MKASNPQKVKKNNLVYLMTLIRELGPLSKRELSEKSGLSVVTINKLIPELIDRELIKPYSREVITGGRFASSYSFNEKKFYSLIIKLIEKDNQMSFYFYLCDLSGTIWKKKELNGYQLEWTDLLATIDVWQKLYPNIKSIVLGIPGVENSGIVTLVDYPMLRGKNIKKELENRYECLIQIENDVNAAILGFSTKEATNLIIAGIYYPIGFPPGGGVTIHQKLLKGNNNYAGEVASLPLAVNWSTVNINQLDLKEHFLDIVKVYISLYDPHKIVAYVSKNRLNEEQEIIKLLKKDFPLIQLPEIIFTETFEEDYLLGLITLGLKQLNEQLKNIIEIGE